MAAAASLAIVTAERIDIGASPLKANCRNGTTAAYDLEAPLSVRNRAVGTLVKRDWLRVAVVFGYQFDFRCIERNAEGGPEEEEST